MIKVNGVEIKVQQFPNSESYIDKYQITKALSIAESDKKNHTITFKYESDADLIHLMFIKKFRDSMITKKSKILLRLVYMPYSRMDRENDNYIFTLKYITDFINSLNFDLVLVNEAHSMATLNMLDNVEGVNTTLELFNSIKDEIDFDYDKDRIVLPDKGALKRYNGLFSPENEIIGDKERDFESGRITKLDLYGNIPKEPFNAVILDDLCSKGGTFLLTATKLKELGAKKIYLVVAHCEKTILEGSVLESDLIEEVYTTNSIINISDISAANVFANPSASTKVDTKKIIIKEVI